LRIITPCDIDVLLHAQALLVEGPEPEQRRHHAGLRRAVVPFGGLVEILRHALAFGKAHADLVSRGRVALQCGGAQYRAADAVRQPLGRRHGDRGQLAPGGGAVRAPAGGGIVVIAPVMSAAAAGGGAACGGIAIRALSSVFGAEELFDCFSTGVGEIIKGAGAGAAGLVLLSAGVGDCAGAAGSPDCSIIGSCSTLPVS